MNKVLLVGSFGDGAFAYAIFNTFIKELNYYVQPFDPTNERALGKSQDEIDDAFKILCNGFDPDIIFTIKPRDLSSKIIKEQPEKKICWWLDNRKRYGDIDKYYDVHDKFYLCESDQGMPWMPIGIIPQIHKPTIASNDKEKDYFKSNIVFCGTAHAQRALFLIKTLNSLPYIVKVWGNSWNSTIFDYTEIKYMGKAIYWDKLMKAYTNTDIILNNHYEKGITPNMRCIEAPASGTLLLSDSGNGLEQCLKKNEEFVAYDTIRDARYMIVKYMEEEEERFRIAKNGYRRVNKDHLLKDKLKEMIK